MPEKLRMISFHAASAVVERDDAGNLPSEMLVLKWGENMTSKGRVIVNEKTLRELPLRHAELNWDQIALDFEHNTVPGSPTYRGEPAIIAGYNKPSVVPQQGVVITMTSWTDAGKQFGTGGHYKDLSATVVLDDDDVVVALHSVALCRMGAAQDILFLQAPGMKALVSLLSATSTTTTHMDANPPANAEELFTALKTALGLGADADPAAVMAAFTAKLTEATTALSAAAEAAGKKKDGEGEGDEVKTLSATVKALADSMKALTSKLEESERTAILSAAAREGKEVPKSAHDLPLDKLKTLCAELPVTVPVERRSETTIMLTSGAGEPREDEISKHTGVSADDRKKYGAL